MNYKNKETGEIENIVDIQQEYQELINNTNINWGNFDDFLIEYYIKIEEK